MKTLILFMAFGSGEPDFSAFEDPKPQPQQTELRLVNGVLYQVPVGTDWSKTTQFPPYRTLTQPVCPDGRCNLPNR